MRLFDTHFHYDGTLAVPEYRKLVAENARRCGIVPGELRLAAMGGSMKESLLAQRFAREDENAVYSVGVHPSCAAEFTGKAAEAFAAFRDDPKLRAIGELGLDYYYDADSAAAQKKVLEDFLHLALDWQLPAIIHLRDKGSGEAYADGLALLKDFASGGGRFVVHCFSGTPAQLSSFLELGGWAGVTGMVTFRKAENIRELIPLIPAEKLLIETDSPYLAPLPFRGESNTPGFVGLVAKMIGEIRGISTEDAAELTFRNGENFFALKGNPIP